MRAMPSMLCVDQRVSDDVLWSHTHTYGLRVWAEKRGKEKNDKKFG
jgi:hypothetical protein